MRWQGKLIAAAIFWLPYVAPAPAQPPFRVSVSVKADDTLRPRLLSCLNRELRKLRDVSVVDERPDRKLSVVGVTFAQGAAMAISVVATQPSVGAPTVRYLAPFIDERSVESIAKYLTVMEQQEGHWLYTDATAKLADVCREIVAALDSESLESARKIREKLAGSR